MAEEEKQSEAPAAEATESSDTGFANRRLHNYPLIRVSIYSTTNKNINFPVQVSGIKII